MQILTETNVMRLFLHSKRMMNSTENTSNKEKQKKLNLKINRPQKKTKESFTQKNEQTNITNRQWQLYSKEKATQIYEANSANKILQKTNQIISLKTQYQTLVVAIVRAKTQLLRYLQNEIKILKKEIESIKIIV